MKTTQSPESQEIAHLAALRAQLAAEIATFHEKEASLRAYEQRVRTLLEQTVPASPPAVFAGGYPFMPGPGVAGSHVELAGAWEKHHRAHALLEAARRGLTDDRLALRHAEERLRAREEAVSRREEAVQQREAALRVAAVAAEATAAEELVKPKPKSKLSFTTAPFAVAKNLLSPRRA